MSDHRCESCLEHYDEGDEGTVSLCANCNDEGDGGELRQEQDATIARLTRERDAAVRLATDERATRETFEVALATARARLAAADAVVEAVRRAMESSYGGTVWDKHDVVYEDFDNRRPFVMFTDNEDEVRAALARLDAGKGATK